MVMKIFQYIVSSRDLSRVYAMENYCQRKKSMANTTKIQFYFVSEEASVEEASDFVDVRKATSSTSWYNGM